MQTLHKWYKSQHDVVEFSEPLIIQDQIASDVYPNPGVVIWNPKGKNILRTVDVHTKRVWNNQELVDKFVMLHDMPLAFWQATNCDTCDKIIQAGFDNVEEAACHLQLMRSLTKEVFQQPAARWIDTVMCIIELMPSGFYYLTLLDYYPTDGNGNFFWDVFQHPRCWSALKLGREPSDAFPDPYQSRPPCYLAPSQAPTCFSNESLERAKANYATHPGLALKLHEQGSLLLDGHHRATAAALQGVPFSCLTIVSCGRSRISGAGINVRESIPKLFRKWLQAKDAQENARLSLEEYRQKHEEIFELREQTLDMISKSTYPWTLPAELNLQHAAEQYPILSKQGPSELAQAYEAYERMLYPAHVKYSEDKLMQEE